MLLEDRIKSGLHRYATAYPISMEEDEGARAAYAQFLNENKTIGIKSNGKTNHRPRWLAGMISAVCLTMFVAGGFAAMKMYQLKSTNGAVTYSIEHKDGTWKEWKSNSDAPDYYRGFYGQLEEIERNLEPGQVVAVYGREPDYSFTVSQPFAVTDFEQFSDKVSAYFRLPKELISGYRFTAGFLDYHKENGRMYLEEMRKEAIQTNQSILVKPLKIYETMMLDQIKVVYEGEQGSVKLEGTIFRGGGGKIEDIAPGDAQIEHVKVKGEEAIYTLLTDEEGNELQKVTWLENRNNGRLNIYYMLSTEARGITKNSFLEMANRLP